MRKTSGVLASDRAGASPAAWFLAVALVVAAGSLFGCAQPVPPANQAAGPAGAGAENRLRVGDELLVRLDNGNTQGAAAASPETITVSVDEHGEISLPLVSRIGAADATPSELAERIEANYVPRFYVRCRATVQVSARYFYVGGEVRAPGRYAWSQDTTLLKAINTAGSFSDYANRGRVEVMRGKEKLVVDCEELRRNPDKDLPIRPGDSIWVARSIF